MRNIDENPAIIRGVYKINSRNLGIAVWDGRGFMGIREKFGSFFLFTEFPATNDGRDMPYETVREWEALGVQVPDDILLDTNLDTICDNCKTKAEWTGPPAPAAWKCEGGCASGDVRPVTPMNKDLFNFLEKLAKEHDLMHEASPRSLKEIIENKNS